MLPSCRSKISQSSPAEWTFRLLGYVTFAKCTFTPTDQGQCLIKWNILHPRFLPVYTFIYWWANGLGWVVYYGWSHVEIPLGYDKRGFGKFPAMQSNSTFFKEFFGLYRLMLMHGFQMLSHGSSDRLKGIKKQQLQNHDIGGWFSIRELMISLLSHYYYGQW